MRTIKSYTDLEQSKKLTEILPFESADMHYNNASIKGIDYTGAYKAELMDYNAAKELLSMFVNPMFEVIPCWSLVALLNILPSATLDSSDDHNFRVQCMKKSTEWYDNPVDACYEMILKLHELKIL